MGVVYRAHDIERGVDVALKTLRGITPESVLRFKTEFRALRDVRHPNLVELGELFENDGTWFFTMELIRGETLLDWLQLEEIAAVPADDTIPSEAPTAVIARERGRQIDRLAAPRCDVARLRAALAGLARGLAALHAKGKVHRDVKPSNILVDAAGRVVLLDFGVVAELHQAHPEKRLFGTVKYMAPEQARGELVGPQADWYAMGVLLYQGLTGRPPFHTVTSDELLVLKQHVDPPAPSELADNVPADLDLLARGLLDRDPTRRPSEAEILDALGIDTDDAPVEPAHVDRWFVGRQRELAVLDEALAESRNHAVSVLVEGESGVGKTALVERFIELARGADPRVVVLRGRCHERERIPFNAFDGVIDDLARFLLAQREARVERLVPDGVSALLAVFPALRAVEVLADAGALETASTIDVRGKGFAALRALLGKLSRRRTVIITLDDLQWADPDSRALLRDLMRAADAPNICLVATQRRGTFAATRTIELAGLPPDDAKELIRLCGAPASASQIVAETHGHPLFIRELARVPSGRRLDDAIWTRVARLDVSAQRLLAAIALAGSPISRPIAIAAAGIPAAEAERHIAALTRESFVRAHGNVLETFHDRIREAVQAHYSGTTAILLALARAHEEAAAPPTQLLALYEAAGDQERVAHYLIAAAEAARAAFAFSRAAELWRRALEALPQQRGRLLVELADALANDGRTAEAAECYLQAASLEPTNSDRHLDLLRRAAERFLMSGRLQEGLETTRAVLARANMTLPASRLRTVAGIVWNQLRMRGGALRWQRRETRSLDADICWSIGAGLGMVDTLLGAYFSGRAARLALAEGNSLQITRGMGSAMIGAALLGRRKRCDRLYACTERAAAEDGSPLAHWYLGMAGVARTFILDNDWTKTFHDATALEDEWYAAGRGPAWETDVAMHFSLASLQMLGDVRELGHRVATLVHNAQRNGDLFQEVTLRVRFAVRHLAEGQPDEAERDVNDALAAWLPGTDSFGNQRAWALWCRTRNALYTGTLPDDLEAEWKRMFRSLVGRIPLMQAEYLHVYGTYLLARAHIAKHRGERSDHAALCRATLRVADRLGRLPVPAARSAEAVLHAGVAWAREHPDLVTLTREALDRIIEHHVFVYAPFLKRRLGEAMGGEEGAALVAQADDLALRSGWSDPVRGAELVLPTGRFSW